MKELSEILNSTGRDGTMMSSEMPKPTTAADLLSLAEKTSHPQAGIAQSIITSDET